MGSIRAASVPAVVCGLALALAAFSAHAFALRGGVIGNGAANGATTITGVRLHGTVGQAAVGYSNGVTFRACHGFWCFGGTRVVAVDPAPDSEQESRLPTELAFGLPSPNPSRGVTRFTLALPEAAEVAFTVYDVSGRQVGEEVRRTFEAGWHQLSWSAPGDRAGVYFARLSVDGAIKASRRMVLVR